MNAAQMSRIEDAPQRGCLFIVSGPSGVGKSTLVQRLLKSKQQLRFSVSYTTRPKRPQEVEGKHYHFVDAAQFERMIAQDAFLEYAQYNGNWYGTPAAPVHRWMEEGHDVVLEIEVQGAQQLRRKQAQLGIPMRFIFLLPPSFEQLKARIMARGTEDETKQEKRLKIAEVELSQAGWFDVHIVNDQLDVALRQLMEAVEPSTGTAA